MPIAYALAADHPDRVDRLVVSEAPLPGVSPSPPLFLPPLLNARLWHLAFNQLPVINEQLVTGREDIFGAEFDASAGTHKLPADVVTYYVDTLAWAQITTGPVVSSGRQSARIRPWSSARTRRTRSRQVLPGPGP